ncbi:MAG: hypothetical protein MZV64_59250 [Ignavibacteriales bacterium]|nr:hypothetical protein [Ignavibacteriales bacterium]
MSMRGPCLCSCSLISLTGNLVRQPDPGIGTAHGASRHHTACPVAGLHAAQHPLQVDGTAQAPPRAGSVCLHVCHHPCAHLFAPRLRAGMESHRSNDLRETLHHRGCHILPAIDPPRDGHPSTSGRNVSARTGSVCTRWFISSHRWSCCTMHGAKKATSSPCRERSSAR